MEDRGIKSALELAMEKMADMPELTQEELIKQKKREYEPRGAAIASKYLKGALRERDLPAEFLRYRGQEGEIVRKAFLSALVQTVKLEDMNKGLRALDGIRAVETKANVDEVKREVEAISNEFRQQIEQRYQLYEDLGRNKLRELGISGSTVRPNLKESEDWRQELNRIQSGYDSRIDKLKENLTHLLGI